MNYFSSSPIFSPFIISSAFFKTLRVCSMPKGISLNTSFISIIIFSLKHKLPPFIPYRCFSSIYTLFCSPIQSASWDGAFHPASPEYPSCIPAAAAPQYDLVSNPHFKWGGVNFYPSRVYYWFRQRRGFAAPLLLVAR